MSSGDVLLDGHWDRKPGWLKQPLPDAKARGRMQALLRSRGLHTVCESASCPNLGTCFGNGTATFLIMGDVCTRGCRFCGVDKGVPPSLDPAEPEHVAEAAAELGLSHVVVTSVTRDDLEDGGAGHYVATMEAVRKRLPGATVEVLVPDFAGREQSLHDVLAAVPEVLAHNVETVARLYPAVRPKADYARSLGILRKASAHAGSAVKTGLMLGLGETETEVGDVLRDVAEAGVDMLTIGQYLRPAQGSAPVAEYLVPEVFDRYATAGEGLGLLVQAGPFVRSSFRAGEALSEVRRRGRK